jgi:hypothetical protein
MDAPTKILLQTTIPATVDDWSIARFSLLAALLRAERDASGQPLFEVTVRDRDPSGPPDSLLAALDKSDFDQLWLFAVDVGHGLTVEDCEGISAFSRHGGGLLVARDHMDLGSSVCGLAGIGAAHHFHSVNIDPQALREVDDPYTTNILWPNFHSGANGDHQSIDIVGDVHPVFRSSRSPTGTIRFLPSHPHEGAVSAPPAQNARVIARGRSQVTGRPFNIAVAFEPRADRGPAIAQSTFHHFADYNWDPRQGSPSFVTEPAGDGFAREPAALAEVHDYARNVARWLSPSKAGRGP